MSEPESKKVDFPTYYTSMNSYTNELGEPKEGLTINDILLYARHNEDGSRDDNPYLITQIRNGSVIESDDLVYIEDVVFHVKKYNSKNMFNRSERKTISLKNGEIYIRKAVPKPKDDDTVIGGKKTKKKLTRHKKNIRRRTNRRSRQ